MDVSAHYAGTICKWTIAVLLPISRTSVKADEGKLLQWEELWAVHLVVDFLRKEKWADM